MHEEASHGHVQDVRVPEEHGDAVAQQRIHEVEAEEENRPWDEIHRLRKLAHALFKVVISAIRLAFADFVREDKDRETIEGKITEIDSEWYHEEVLPEKRPRRQVNEWRESLLFQW